MYDSYQASDLWPFLEKLPDVKNLNVGVVRASASAFSWPDVTVDRINALAEGPAAGKGVHMLSPSAHWVHTDNPSGLLEILRPTFYDPNLKKQGRGRK